MFETQSPEVFRVIWGSHQIIWRIPLPNVTWYSETCPFTIDTFHRTDISLNPDLVAELDLITDIDLITKFREISIEYLKRVRLDDRKRFFSSGHLVLPVWDLHFSHVDIILSWTYHVSGLRISNIPQYFYFALKMHQSGLIRWIYHFKTVWTIRVIYTDIEPSLVIICH